MEKCLIGTDFGQTTSQPQDSLKEDKKSKRVDDAVFPCKTVKLETRKVGSIVDRIDSCLEQSASYCSERLRVRTSSAWSSLTCRSSSSASGQQQQHSNVTSSQQHATLEETRSSCPTDAPTIAQALWRPLWPPGWRPRGSSISSTKTTNNNSNTASTTLSNTGNITLRSIFKRPLITMSEHSDEACADDGGDGSGGKSGAKNGGVSSVKSTNSGNITSTVTTMSSSTTISNPPTTTSLSSRLGGHIIASLRLGPSSCDISSSSEEYESMEAWLDEHPKFFCDYVIRKAPRSTIDAWILAHSVPHSAGPSLGSASGGGPMSCPGAPSSGSLLSSSHGFLGHSASSASAPASGATTPVRKISAHEFEKGSLFLRPMVSTTEEGIPTFLQIPDESSYGSESTSGSYPRCPPTRSRSELEQLDEKQLIFELVKDICNDLDIDSLNHKILKNVSMLTNADRCSLFLVKGEPGDPNRHFVSTLFDVSSHSSIEEAKQQGPITVPWGQGIVGYVAESRESVNIDDCYSDSRFSNLVDQMTGFKTRNMLCSPIFDHYGQVMGVAQVINKLPPRKSTTTTTSSTECFSQDDERIFNQYLQFCGIGLRNAQLFERSQLENKRNQVLLDLARMVFEEQSTIEHIVHRIMVHTQSLLGCERCQVLLVTETTGNRRESMFDLTFNELSPPLSESLTEYTNESSRTFSRVFDLSADDVKEDETCCEEANKSILPKKSPFEGRFPINIGITGYVATTGETLNIPNAYEDPRFDASVDSEGGFIHKSILCMPIKNAERKIIGVSQLINKLNGQPFNKNDENLFEAFAIFCGMGIHNTQMYEKAIRAMAKQRVTFECLSFHAAARREEAISLSREPVPSTQALSLACLDFNDFALESDDMMLVACIRMFLDLDLINRFSIDYLVLCRWLLSVRKNYRPVTYHNWRHAFNVAQVMFAILVQTQLCRVFGELETLALIMACLCHDLDHRGTNNSFQIKSSSPLATLYSTSTMEHHHFDQSLMILNSEGNQILSGLSPGEYKTVVQVMEEAILATDLAVYFRNRSEFIKLVQSGSYDWNNNESDRRLLRGMLMTACDIAAITKPWSVQKVVAELVATEFFQQGDIEKEKLNIEPIDMMNRDKKDELPRLQVSFIDSICLPIYQAFAQLYPSKLNQLAEGVIANKRNWLKEALDNPVLVDWATKELDSLEADPATASSSAQ